MEVDLQVPAVATLEPECTHPDSANLTGSSGVASVRLAATDHLGIPQRRLPNSGTLAAHRPSNGVDVSPLITDDQLLIERCRSGHPEAFGDLVSKYQRRLVRTLGTLLGNSHDALDVAQDAFLQAFLKLDSFRGESAFYSWLFRIAWNAAATLRRKQRVRSGASLDAMREQTGAEPNDLNPASDPSHSLQSFEDQQLLRQALSELGEDYRTALVLKEIEGLSYEDIASLTESPIGTVRSRIHRARLELRAKLDRTLKAVER